MTPVPLELPLRPAEAAGVGNLIFEHAERRPLTDEVRSRIAARGSSLRLETIKPYFGSLDRDPIHPSVYYLAVDGERGEPLLLHLALATAPTSSIFYKPLLIGRMRGVNGPEMVINAIPFGPADYDNLDKFCSRIDSSFLPRPQGTRGAIAIGGDRPVEILPAAFDAFRSILKRSGKNLAATSCTGFDGQKQFYYAGLWAAIRAGWREGYSAATEILVDSETLESTKHSIRDAPAFSIVRVNASRLWRDPTGWSGTEVERTFQASLSSEESAWILGEFGRPLDLGDEVYHLAIEEVQRLGVKFGPALRAVERVQELVRQARSSLKTGRSFDVETSLEGSGAVTTAKELMFCLHWLKSRGHAAQLVAPELGAGIPEAGHLKELAAVARHYHALLSIRAAGNHGPEIVDLIAKATVGRVHYRLSGEGVDVREVVDMVARQLAG